MLPEFLQLKLHESWAWNGTKSVSPPAQRGHVLLGVCSRNAKKNIRIVYFCFTWMCTQFNKLFLFCELHAKLELISIAVCFLRCVSFLGLQLSKLHHLHLLCMFIPYTRGILSKCSNTRWKHVTTYTLCRRKKQTMKINRKRQQFWLLAAREHIAGKCLKLDCY